jgi:TonB family protein
MMKAFWISVLASLVLTAGAQVWAQSPSQTPAPLSERERIELCKKKKNTPLEPSATQPLHVEDSAGKVTRPTVIHHVNPRFSGSAGTVVVETVIDEDGCVRQTRVVQSAGKGQDDAAVRSIEQWVFLPATQDGHPVRVFYNLTVNTSIR